jgi:hypothetical protein
MINWKPVKDRIVEGDSTKGKVWIKLGKDGYAISMYIICGDYKEKFFPEDAVELELDFMQFRAEIELEKLAGRSELISKLGV